MGAELRISEAALAAARSDLAGAAGAMSESDVSPPTDRVASASGIGGEVAEYVRLCATARSALSEAATTGCALIDELAEGGEGLDRRLASALHTGAAESRS
ncbi:hypothetical protein ACFPZL_05635 [Leucobacter soli]|uniref:Uncharacterized protein n=1 Tax=Leucobacter soli TaxID=2812850 RepID=A0A916JX55_9MICO|nr:hypothetical protein [Leucobacter soli]CAG7604298.1 hypothetical protein LEUCIP111803_00723 [Leucobacter soli]